MNIELASLRSGDVYIYTVVQNTDIVLLDKS